MNNVFNYIFYVFILILVISLITVSISIAESFIPTKENFAVSLNQLSLKYTGSGAPYFEGPRGIRGDNGPSGPRGIRGMPGEQGDNGPRGPNAVFPEIQVSTEEGATNIQTLPLDKINQGSKIGIQEKEENANMIGCPPGHLIYKMFFDTKTKENKIECIEPKINVMVYDQDNKILTSVQDV